MNRVVALPMIAALLSGMALPPSHCGLHGHEPSAHAALPHVHLSHGAIPWISLSRETVAGHQMREPEAVPAFHLPADHDADALYLGDANLDLPRLAPSAQPGIAASLWILCAADTGCSWGTCWGRRIRDPYGGRPVYARTGCLLI